MQHLNLDADMMPKVVKALAQSPLFAHIAPDILERVSERGTLWSAEPGDFVVHEDTESDSFAVLLAGEVAVYKNSQGQLVEIARLHPPESVGEMGLLMGAPRTATVRATTKSLLLRFDRDAFFIMHERVPGFGVGISRALAARLAQASHEIPMQFVDAGELDPVLVAMLPVEFISRQRVVPIAQEGNRIVLGFVDDASPRVIQLARDLLPGMEISPVRIDASVLERALSSYAGVQGWSASPIAAPFDVEEAGKPKKSDDDKQADKKVSPRLDALLRRMVAEGCSDLHLSGGQKPRWRVDGQMHEVNDTAPLGLNEVLEIIDPVMDERARKAFAEDNDADFAYAIADVARFRVNLFRDKGGVGAVLRQIPAKILSIEQLNLPPVVTRMCENPKGLVLVTGPTGSGKSTTLAAMIDFLNKSRRGHIITLEDPIEFVHKSELCLVNQREVGAHTKSFHRALKAALREDPDIVLVGEMRDLETISLALETANTGHLVFGTLHTATAISTVDRIIDVFPGNQQAQVRAVLADTIKGVLAQALCRRIGGGRVAALETLVVSYAVANMIREGKTHQLASAMATSKAQGNMLLNDSLAQLVNAGVVEYEEALAKAIDKADLARRCNKPSPLQQQQAN